MLGNGLTVDRASGKFHYRGILYSRDEFSLYWKFRALEELDEREIVEAEVSKCFPHDEVLPQLAFSETLVADVWWLVKALTALATGTPPFHMLCPSRWPVPPKWTKTSNAPTQVGSHSVLTAAASLGASSDGGDSDPVATLVIYIYELLSVLKLHFLLVNDINHRIAVYTGILEHLAKVASDSDKEMFVDLMNRFRNAYDQPCMADALERISGQIQQLSARLDTDNE